VPEETIPKRDWVKPLMGAFVCFLLFRIALFFIYPAIEFLGGKLMGITLGMLLSAAIASALAMAIFESRRFTDLGLHWQGGSRRNLLTGLVLGGVAAAAVILVPLAFGMAHFAPLSSPDISWRGDLFLPVLLLCGAMAEELAFRGFVLQYLVRGWGAWAALLSTGALFGLLHDGNPGATWLSDVNTGLFGVLFGYAVLRSHDLWLPIGMHFGWNVTLPFLGVELSGLTIRVTGYEVVWNSGDLWSGGKYGPEASPLTSIVIVLLFLAVWKAPLRRGWTWLLDEPLPGDSPGDPPGDQSRDALALSPPA
jgi:membrane protease YdiL (CAAX protease family)